jgi:hypothetical protein
MLSLVVPGRGDTIATSLPASTLSSELFPLLGGPSSTARSLQACGGAG